MKKFICIILLLLLAGCSSSDDNTFNKGDTSYDQPVTKIVIDWTAGNVEINYHDENTITIFEDITRPLQKDELVRTKLEGGVLTVRYCKAETTIDDMEKDLIISLPADTKLKEVDCTLQRSSLIIFNVAVTDSIVCQGVNGFLEADLPQAIRNISITSEAINANLNLNGAESIRIDNKTCDFQISSLALIKAIDVKAESSNSSFLLGLHDFEFKGIGSEVELLTDLEYQSDASSLRFGQGGTAYNLAIDQGSIRVIELEAE